MQKPILIAEARTTRELMPGADLDAALKSGSYVLVQRPHPPSETCKKQRRFRDKCLAAGDKETRIYLPRDVVDLMLKLMIPGESQVKFISRAIYNLANDYQSGTQK
jgi:hypothetical protein